MRLNRTTRIIGVILFIVFLIAAVALLLPGVRGGLGGLYAAYLILSGQIDYTIAGDSMSPNYNNDEQWKFEEYNNQIPQRGDTVLFDAEESYEENSGSKRLRVKRIVGLPGETVLIQDGSVFINGKFLNEASYLLPETKTSGGSVLRNGEEIVIPEGEYMLLGDNRTRSADSREIGFIPRDDIVAILTTCVNNCQSN